MDKNIKEENEKIKTSISSDKSKIDENTDSSLKAKDEKVLKNVKDINKEDSSKEINKNIIADLKKKLDDNEDRLLRALADNENIRKRHEKDMEDTRKYVIQGFASSLLTVSDNFQRAMQSIPDDISDDNKLLKNLVVGIKAVEKEFYDVFEKNGISKFVSLDKKFDPELHQAVSQINSDKNEGQIVQELQKGFKIGDRLLRPAMVIVSKGKEIEEKDKKNDK